MNKKRRYRKRNSLALDLPARANRVLMLVLLAMGIVMARVWHLSVIQNEEKSAMAAGPRKKVIIEPAKRGTIRDRFNLPLAVNKVQYQAALYYSHLKEIPSIAWEMEEGKKKKKYKRKEYVSRLSELLASELGLDPERVEDQIYSKAIFYQNIPFVLKEDLTEKEYYRIKMLEKDWPGLSAQKVAKRTYPQGRVGAEVVGYIGAINREEYQGVLEELSFLRESLEESEDPSSTKARIRQLQEKAYTLNDHIGKAGVEASFEEELRGSIGKKVYYADAQGNCLHEMPGGCSPQSGNRILLTISSELQAFAEELLIRREGAHEAFFLERGKSKTTKTGCSFPWIRGGAIVVMEPKSGEVLALASYPRFDPNDFISSGDPEIERARQKSVQKWYESPSYIGMLWDQILPLEREEWEGGAFDRQLYLTFDHYLDFILPPEHEVRKGLANVKNIRGAVEFQRRFEELAALADSDQLIAWFDLVYKEDEPFYKDHQAEVVSIQGKEGQVAALKKKLAPYFSGVKENYNKFFLFDLCRILVQHEYFEEGLLDSLGGYSFTAYREISAAYVDVSRAVQGLLKGVFHDHHFKSWRELNQKKFLKQKREEERQRGQYAKPYLDYFDQVEAEQFYTFWERNQHDFLRAFLTGQPLLGEELAPYSDFLLIWHEELTRGAHRGTPWIAHYDRLQKELAKMPADLGARMMAGIRSFDQLDRPLAGRYRNLRGEKNRALEKDLAAAFYPRWGFGFSRSYAFRQSAIQGSIFKLVTAYEALIQRYYEGVSLTKLNPMEIIDEVRKVGTGWRVGYWADGTPIPRMYKGGRLPKSLSRNIGKTDLVKALERSSNPYFALLAVDHLKHPEDLVEAAANFSYGSATGIDLLGEIGGYLPKNLEEDRTNLYSTAIGQGTMVVTPLQTAVMLSTLANGGEVLRPQIAKFSVSSSKKEGEFAFKESLASIGIDFPLFSFRKQEGSEIVSYPPDVLREVDLPGSVRNLLFHGMRRVVEHTKGFTLAPIYQTFPSCIDTFVKMKPYMIGKTSSSESMERVSFDRVGGVEKLTHGWFGGILFDQPLTFSSEETVSYEKYGEPKLVVVVYLPYSVGGKDAMPIMAEIGQKWMQITKNK